MSTTRTPKEELFAQFARVGRTLASPSRLLILDLLSQGEKAVETLADQARLSVSNVSNHLKELREASLVRTRRDRQRILYSLASPTVGKLLRSLQGVAHEHLAEVRELIREYYQDPDAFEPVDADRLHRLVSEGDVIVLDVRPTDEWVAGHIPGAVSVPVDELDRRLAEFPRDREIVAYCRGRYCLFSRQAVATLRSHGFRAQMMVDGVAEWEERGYSVTFADDPSAPR